MTQEEIKAKFELAQSKGKQLFPFEVEVRPGEYEEVYLFADELSKQHKDLLLQQFIQSYTVLPKDIQEDFIKIVTKPKLTDKLIIVPN